MKDEEVGCTVGENNYAVHLFYGKTPRWGQIMYLTGKELKQFRQIVWNSENNMRYGFEIINQIIDKGGRFKTRQTQKAKAVDIDTSKDIEIARSVIV